MKLEYFKPCVCLTCLQNRKVTVLAETEEQKQHLETEHPFYYKARLKHNDFEDSFLTFEQLYKAFRHQTLREIIQQYRK